MDELQPLLRFPASRLWPDPASGPDTCHGTIQPLASTDVAAAPETAPATVQSVMDDPPARVVPVLPLPRPPEPPEPSGGFAKPGQRLAYPHHRS
jgi:hypothetical protein